MQLDLSGLADAPPPAWETRPVKPDAMLVPARVYTAKQGDSLRLIAAKMGAGAEAIARANGLVAPYAVTAGQQIKIPAGRYHEVKAGETGIAIARAYTIPWREIVSANGLAAPFVLRSGERLLIPGEAPLLSPDQRIAQRAAAFRIDIDDIMTGGEPARTQVAPPPIRTPAIVTTTLPPGRFAWPASGSVVGRFGPQGSGRISQGIDIAAAPGTPILAAGSGTVAYVGNAVPGYGGLILVRHDGNWYSAYGHAGDASVKKGDRVRAGETIGAAAGDAPLHFELRRARAPVDPLAYLPKR